MEGGGDGIRLTNNLFLFLYTYTRILMPVTRIELYTVVVKHRYTTHTAIRVSRRFGIWKLRANFYYYFFFFKYYFVYNK